MTATATKKAPAKKAEQKEVTFVTKRPGLVLTVSPELRTRNADGIVIDITPAQRIEFQGMFFTTSDPELIDFIRSHPRYNVTVWEQGNAPDAPRPTVKEQMAALTRASVAKDADGIKAVLQKEKDTHQREEILLAGKAALEAIAEG